MPGANTRALEKAKGLSADSLILDLEDAVAPDAKAEARDNVVAALTSGEYGNRELTINLTVVDASNRVRVHVAEASGQDLGLGEDKGGK